MSNADGVAQEAQSWKQLYEAALLELDPDKLPNRIADAQKAIGERAAVLSRENGNSGAEKDALGDAQVAMNDLMRIHQTKQQRAMERVA